MKNTLGWPSLSLLFGISLLLILLGVFASDGFFILDEFIYFAGVQSFSDSGGFSVSNGFEQFGSEDLRLWLLVEGPSGLVPQYPIGTTLAGAALLGLFGQKSLIALNVLAGIGTLCFTYALARRMFPGRFVGDLAVLLMTFCTFWIEYVVGHWPHSVSMLTVTAAIYFFVSALDRENGEAVLAMAAAFLIGFGVLFRLEGVLVLPGIAALTVIYARSPVKVLVSGMIGLMPFAVVIAWSNFVRFGSLNPLSYGSTGGGTDLVSYLPLGAFLGLALLALVTLRAKGSVQSWSAWSISACVIVTVSVILLPQLSAMVLKVSEGVRSLLIDATRLSDPRSGVQSNPDGTLSFWGLPKKALGQSLPWLGCLALLVGLQWNRERRSFVISLTICLIWALPFLVRSWHGGLGLNMRYFLPLLPLLAGMSAFLITLWIDRFGHLLLVAGVVMGLVIAVLWQVNLTVSTAEFHQITTTRVVIFVVLVSLVSGFIPKRSTSGLALAAVGFGMGVATVLALQDLAFSQSRRANMASASETSKSIEGSVVLYGAPEAHSYALRNPKHLLALPNPISESVDFSFVAAACKDGYRVLFPSEYLVSNLDLNVFAEVIESPTNSGRAVYAEANCTLINQAGSDEIPDS
ncbi:Dolichyl-phosphate-mannose-protein mannosyltransferase [Ruegeria halocynthiae]|uniref:Dolichyl-phosphate-mannose-protein mannosyltransferase n=1 Tax=Ruegeria halocynthiae TaxID=985054 RepID=A0A1H2ZKW1_9RHOB|nr:glycosyltransferase family 39 protein [Ruegeria halocynthiae]SDX18050.1 Dolichyl-phosphate-mannose-protein mannosyltransferase [Ruegeria halocynthiae]